MLDERTAGRTADNTYIDSTLVYGLPVVRGKLPTTTTTRVWSIETLTKMSHRIERISLFFTTHTHVITAILVHTIHTANFDSTYIPTQFVMDELVKQTPL